MTIDIKCDFCKKPIEIKKGKGLSVAIDSVEIKEYICAECKLINLQQTWEEIQSDLEKEWAIVEKEKRNFFEGLLRNQKKIWLIEKKKNNFGTFYKEES